MKRTLWTAAIALTALAATILLVGDRHGVTPEAADTIASDVRTDDVEVRHEFVTIAAPTMDRVVEVRSVAAPRPVRRARPGDPLLAKARRALLGDGRYRPEPFPRVK